MKTLSDDKSVLQSSAATVNGRASDSPFEFGLWVRSLESFMSIGDRVFPDLLAGDREPRNRKNEFQISQAILMKCCELEVAIRNDGPSDGYAETSKLLRELLSVNTTMVRAEPLKPIEWKAFGSMASQRIRETSAYRDFERNAGSYGEEALPAALKTLLNDETLSAADRSDLRRFVPRLGILLRSLEVVGRMLREDRPLKVSLPIFAFVYEAVGDLILSINSRLSRYDDESSEMFGMLDAASYTASIELRKAFSEELSTVVGVRSATAVYARVESAYGVLKDCFRQILAGFANLAQPGTTAADIFPEFHSRLEGSIALRSRLWELRDQVAKLEADAERNELGQLRDGLRNFVVAESKHLYFKDQETIERFFEEIIITNDKADLGPILHRFSAFLETLFGQVGMRAVLANHPFDSAR